MKSPWTAAIEQLRALSSPAPYRVKHCGAADRLVVRCEAVTEAAVQQELGGTIPADILRFARFEWTARPQPILLARARAIRSNPEAVTGWTAARVTPTPAEKRIARIATHPMTAAMLAA